MMHHGSFEKLCKPIAVSVYNDQQIHLDPIAFTHKIFQCVNFHHPKLPVQTFSQQCIVFFEEEISLGVKKI